MKKILLFMSVICLLLCISACALPDSGNQNSSASAADETKNGNAATDTSEPTDQLYDQQLPLLAVSLPTVTQSEIAEDGTVLFNYTYQNLSLILPDPEIADSIIIDFLNRIDQTAADAESIRTAAMTDHERSENWTPYLCQITYDPMRIDAGILSMYGSYVTYSGAVHAGAIYRSVSYDLTTGKVLSLDDILTDTADPDQLCQLVIDALSEQKDDTALFDGFEITVAERFAKGYREDTDWFFTNEGLCYFFSPYEIGPYSSGAITAQIPYSKLVGILDDAYFPAEKEFVSGTVLAKSFEDMAQDEFSRFVEIVLADQGSKLLLYTDTAVYDVRIESGSLSSDDNSFTPEYTVFSAYGLSNGNAVMVQTDTSETQSVLRLSYFTEEGTVYQYLKNSSLVSAV